MRVISGFLKGRVLLNHKIEGTRPTMDRVKESLFAMIQSYLEDCIFLDLFAGSGSIGIEAISCGAKKCFFVDKNSLCTKDILNNIHKFSIELQSQVLTMDYRQALEYFVKNQITFDVIFLDPPYKDEVYEEILSFVLFHHLLHVGGLIICEVATPNLKEKYDAFLQIKRKKYGNKWIFIYKRMN